MIQVINRIHSAAHPSMIQQIRIHQTAVLPFSDTWTGCRVGQRGT